MRIALFSAFPHELREIVRNIGATKPLRKNSFEICRGEYSSHEIIIVQTGIGVRHAENALEYVAEEYAPEVAVSCGFGGALYDGARIGEVVWASHALFITGHGLQFANLRNGRDIFERLSGTLALREGSVVTIDGWKNKTEVRKIVPENLPFPVCDMETFPLAKLSLEKGLRFFGFRSITDRADEEIPPELLDVSDESDGYRLSRALKLLLSRPALIPGSIKLGVYSYIAGRSLWRAVSALIREL